ncbi:hypothetical protein BDR22DRAFT_960464 [Usnea florida]
MPPPTIYLITGANRVFTTVIAGVRDPSLPSVKDLDTLPKGSSSNLIIVKIDSISETDAAAAVETFQSEHSISSIDTVIANAGIAKTQAYGLVAGVKIHDVKEHVDVNAIGPLVLFQATLPLLQKATIIYK